MADIKNSIRLNALIKYAKELGDQKSSVVTAERYLVSVIDAMLGLVDLGEGSMTDIATIIKQYGIDPGQARDALIGHINKKPSALYLDDLYMKKKLKEASDKAEKALSEELTPEMLLECILADPSSAISGCISADKTESAGNMSGFVFDPPKAKKEEEPKTETEPADKIIMEIGSSGTAAPLPEESLSDLTERVRRYRETILESVLGQDKAVSVFAAGYFQSELRALTGNKDKGPRATFLFAGPPGVGKTYLAETIAKTLGIPTVRYDMSEYSDHQSAIQLIGSNAVFQNSKSGSLARFITQNPKSVILFDEIEKAHLNVIHLFLQILDAGSIRDSNTERDISFKDAILIFTTNAGRQLYEDSDTGDFSQVSRKVILKALEKDVNPTTGQPFFPAAICSRFATGNVVMFNRMDAHFLRAIAEKRILEQTSLFASSFGVDVQIDPKVYDAILLAEGGEVDARTVSARAKAFFNEELFELLRLMESEGEDKDISISEMKEIRISVELPGSDPEITGLFESREAPTVLVFSECGVARLCAEKSSDCRFINASDCNEAEMLMKENDVRTVLLDFSCGRKADAPEYLNVEDVASAARDFFHYVRSVFRDMPVYLLQSEDQVFDSEEKLSFVRQGARGFVSLTGDGADFAADIRDICDNLHRQNSMRALAKSNKLITYETAQSVSDDGRLAQIRLFDFKTTTAVSAEDKGNVLSGVSRPNISFDDVIGAEDAKRELRYFVEYMKNPKKYLGTGVAAPKGVILYGPPGTGKTMLAKAMASESSATYIAAEGNQFLKSLVGEGPAAVHSLFATARKYAPSIIFVDEIDAIGKERGSDAGGTGSVSDSVLTAFLTEMDGFHNDPTKPVFVLAATNFNVEPGNSKSLDSAMMRRFDRRILIDLPTKDDRIRFMNMKLASNKAYGVSEDKIANLAVRSTGMSLAQLESVFQMALRAAIRDGNNKVTDEILDDAFETFGSGERKKWDDSELQRTAIHEAGHAFICWKNGETPSYLTVVARSNHGGYMLHGDNEGKGTYTRDELRDRIRVALGGRAAEIAYFGGELGLSTGASGDLATATNLASHIICTYGMDADFGLAVIDSNAYRYGELSAEVRAAVNRILAEEMEAAISTVSENKAAIDAIVSVLTERNHLTGTEIDEIFSGATAG